MEYMTALEREIAMEVTMADIGQKVMSVFKFIGELIRKAIKFLTGLIGKLRKNKKNNGKIVRSNNIYSGAMSYWSCGNCSKFNKSFAYG